MLNLFNPEIFADLWQIHSTNPKQYLEQLVRDFHISSLELVKGIKESAQDNHFPQLEL